MDVTIRKLVKTYGKTDVVRSIDLDIPDGELFTMLGPSGCGKTTTLRCIVGLELPNSGSIHFGNQDVAQLPANARPCGMVFQNYALYPHLTVFENVAYGLKVRLFKQGSFMEKLAVLAGRGGGTSRRSDIRTVVERALELFELGEMGNRNPSQLSGGQQQRVALARALVTEPKVLLLDEPLGALDAKLRVRVREEIRSIQQRLGITTIYVTHDQEEAMAISDKIAIMGQGRVLQVGSPTEIYQNPRTAFVADFLGLANILPGALTADGFCLSDNRLVKHGPSATSNPTQMMIRPEAVKFVGAQDAQRTNVWEVSVLTKSFFGALARLTVAAGPYTLTIDVADPVNQIVPEPGESAHVYLPPERVLLLAE